MPPKLGYLLPTRERVMAGEHGAAALLRLAERAEELGFASVWIGDSLLARARHDPLTLMAAVAARTRTVEIGTAVLLPALRNPVVLAQQVATADRISEGRIVLGIGIAADHPSIRAEFEAAGVPFEKRIGRLVEGMALCRALWSGKPVDWDGRWKMTGAVLGPTPHRPGGPPLWNAASVPAGRQRTGRHFDGWFPNGPTPAQYTAQWAEVQEAARAAGRDAAALTPAKYITLAIDEDGGRADARINDYLERYYNQPAAVIRKRQMCYGGPAAAVASLLKEYGDAGVRHFCVRFAGGDHDSQLATLAKLRQDLGW